MEEAESSDARLAQWLHAARDGDVNAFEAFYAATIRKVLPVARRICGDAHGDDALADAYFQAWSSLHSFDISRGNALAWLTLIVRSRARDIMRKERFRHAGQHGAPDFEPDDCACPSAGPEDMAQAMQQKNALHRAINVLAPGQQLLVRLAYFQDCSHGEMAKQTGQPLGTVKTVMRRTHRQLRTLMEPQSGLT